MKKLIYCALALAAGLFATSCQQELLETAGGNTVTFTVQMPTVATKATIGDEASSINDLVYAVYRTTAEDLKTTLTDWEEYTNLVYQLNPSEQVFTDNYSTTVSLELINNQNYVILFWAQNSDVWVVGEDFDLTNITYPADDNNNMDVNRDAADKYAAFSGVKFLSANELVGKKTVELTRPFAQINIAAADPTIYNVVVNSASMTVGAAGDSFNVASQSAAATKESLTYTWENIPATDGFAVGGTTYEHYVAMGYVFADGNVSVSYSINTDHGTVTNAEAPISNVPVKANYRTNIVGKLLTSNVDYNVTLHEGWYTPENNVEVVSVQSAQELQEAINSIKAGTSGNIQLEDNIDLSALAGLVSTKASDQTYGLLIPENKSLVLDLNGKTLAQSVKCKASYSMIENHGSLTIINSKGEGKISFEDTGDGDPNFGWGSYTIYNYGNLVVNSGTIEHIGEHNTPEDNVHMYCAIQQNNANAVTTINGGTISTPTYRSIRINSGSANFKGGVMDGQVWVQPFAEGIVLNIEGGRFEPNGGDGSSVFVTNNDKAVDFAVTGGFFATKIGCSNPAALAGTVTGGTFTASAKENTPAALYEGYRFVQDEDGENFILEPLPAVAKIGETGYWSLNAAVAAVEDGQTITLVANETFTEANRTHNSDKWYDGLYYIGDKSFTIDLGGKTISQDGAVNDYLLNFKNDGTKENVITLKNGTINAGTAAYCALATSSSNAQKMTINLEKINLINNNSNGAVVKARGGSVLNVNAGTVITGENSYTGIEAAGTNTVVNVNEGAEIYQNGTSSYVGAIVGASQNATLNIYGGKGKSKKCGIIVMSTGATINVSGGEWTANSDGTVAGDNSAVLVSQNNRSESSWACKSILNVTGGTFKGGYNCYGMGPGVEADDAQINIKGGNFNANPTSYLGEGYKANEDNGVWTVIVDPDGEGLYLNDKGVWVVLNAKGLAKANAMMLDNEKRLNVKLELAHDIDFTGNTWTPVDSHVDFGRYISEIDGKGHTISNLTINGQAMFTRFAGPGDVLVTIKNITFDNAKVNSKGSINTAILTGHTYQNVLLENVDVKNSSITGGYKVAPLIGTVYNESSTTITATLKNCDVENVTVKATTYDFCTTGMVAFVNAGDNDDIKFENCTVKNVMLYAPNVYTAHAAIYTTGSETLFNEAEGVTVTNVTFENI